MNSFSFRLPLSGYRWTFQTLPHLPERTTRQLLRSPDNDHNGAWKRLPFGLEARVDLGMQRPTTSKAKRRSERLSAQISTVEWPYPENNSCEIEHFFTASMQRFPVQLNYLYPRIFSAGRRVFAARQRPSGKLMAIASICQYVEGEWSLEVFSRASESPNGTMESLLVDIEEQLRREKANIFSLGEVPFKYDYAKAPIYAPFLAFLGRVGLSPVYNIAGLERFKAKFATHWRPVFLYGYPAITPLAMAELAWHCRVIHLAWDNNAKRVRRL